MAKTFSQIVTEVVSSVKEQANMSRGHGSVSSSLIKRHAVAALRRDGVEEPGSSLVSPVIVAVRDELDLAP